MPVVERSALGTSPSVSPEDPLARAIGSIGAFVLTDVDLSATLVPAARKMATEFFYRPVDEKKAFQSPIRWIFRGYRPPQGSLDRKSAAPDLCEAFTVGPVSRHAEGSLESALSRAEVEHFYAGNIWPDEPASFRRHIEDLYEALSAVSAEVAQFLDRIFLTGSGTVTSAIRNQVSELAVNFYPPASGPVTDAQMRRGAHRDFDLFTLLVPDYETGGLEIADGDGEWIRVEAGPASLVIIAGELMPMLTGQRVPAPRHRVVLPAGDGARQKERVSFAYFVEPDPGYVLDTGNQDDDRKRRRAGQLVMDQIARLVPPELLAS